MVIRQIQILNQYWLRETYSYELLIGEKIIHSITQYDSSQSNPILIEIIISGFIMLLCK